MKAVGCHFFRYRQSAGCKLCRSRWSRLLPRLEFSRNRTGAFVLDVERVSARGMLSSYFVPDLHSLPSKWSLLKPLVCRGPWYFRVRLFSSLPPCQDPDLRQLPPSRGTDERIWSQDAQWLYSPDSQDLLGYAELRERRVAQPQHWQYKPGQSLRSKPSEPPSRAPPASTGAPPRFSK